MALPESDCYNYYFAATSNGVLQNSSATSLESVTCLEAGVNGSVWALANRLVYYSSSPMDTEFGLEDFSSVGLTNFEAFSITFDQDSNSLLVYGYDYTGHRNFFVAADISDTVADVDVRTLDTGNFGIPGSVSSMAAVEGDSGTCILSPPCVPGG